MADAPRVELAPWPRQIGLNIWGAGFRGSGVSGLGWV